MITLSVIMGLIRVGISVAIMETLLVLYWKTMHWRRSKTIEAIVGIILFLDLFLPYQGIVWMIEGAGIEHHVSIMSLLHSVLLFSGLAGLFSALLLYVKVEQKRPRRTLTIMAVVMLAHLAINAALVGAEPLLRALTRK